MMRRYVPTLTLFVLMSAPLGLANVNQNDSDDRSSSSLRHDGEQAHVQVGPRPFFLVNDMKESALKRELLRCSEGPFKRTGFSIGHRGAALQFPEHTRESYEAAARMGAGIVECDVTFTKDKQLVCRHSHADLHTTTNILVTPLASKCFKPFSPAILGPGGVVVTPASAECRTSDITLAEFKTLTGKMDSFNPAAQTPQAFLGGTPNFRTDIYSGPSSGHLLSHKESIELFKTLGVKMTPELKTPSVVMPFNAFELNFTASEVIVGLRGDFERAVPVVGFDDGDDSENRRFGRNGGRDSYAQGLATIERHDRPDQAAAQKYRRRRTLSHRMSLPGEWW